MDKQIDRQIITKDIICFPVMGGQGWDSLAV